MTPLGPQYHGTCYYTRNISGDITISSLLLSSSLVTSLFIQFSFAFIHLVNNIRVVSMHLFFFCGTAFSFDVAFLSSFFLFSLQHLFYCSVFSFSGDYILLVSYSVRLLNLVVQSVLVVIPFSSARCSLFPTSRSYPAKNL